MVWDVLPIVFSTILFGFTLILIFVLRKADQKDRKLELMKRYVLQHKAEMKRNEDQLRQVLEETESRIETRRKEVQQLLHHIESQREAIQTHSEDLQDLYATLTHYHEIMEQLSSTTEKAERRIVSVREDIHQVEKVQDTVAKYATEYAQIEERIERSLDVIHENVLAKQSRFEQHCENYANEIKTDLSAHHHQLLQSTDASLQTMNVALKEVFDQLYATMEKGKAEYADMYSESKNSLLEATDELNRIRDSIQSLLSQKTEIEKAVQEQKRTLQTLQDQAQEAQDVLSIALEEHERFLAEEEEHAIRKRMQVDAIELHDNSVELEEIVPLFEEEEIISIED